MKKRITIVLSVLICIIGLTVITKSYIASEVNSKLASMTKTSDATIYFPYANLDQIIESAPNIIQCKVVSENKIFPYDSIDFVRTDVQITECLRNNDGLAKGQKISILQTKDVDTLLTKQNNLVLCIEKYVGPVTQNAYVIVGYDYGQYIISDKSVKHATEHIDRVKKIAADFSSLDDLKEKIKSISYKKAQLSVNMKSKEDLTNELNDSEKSKEQQLKSK